jgi:hypothetical protein
LSLYREEVASFIQGFSQAAKRVAVKTAAVKTAAVKTTAQRLKRRAESNRRLGPTRTKARN